MSQQARVFEAQITQTVRLGYLLHLPEAYDEGRGTKWPLILFLHGMGERGSDLEAIKKHGIPKVVETRPDFPFITVSPQCPLDHTWLDFLPALILLLDDVSASYAVDPDRVYLTGLSMGGFGTWYLAAAYPERFTAIAPICGGGDPAHGFPEKVCALKDVPVWVFHGGKDDVVPLESSEVLVETLRACGGDVRFTVYPDAGHDSWTETYDSPALYDWFLAHTLAGRG